MRVAMQVSFARGGDYWLAPEAEQSPQMREFMCSG
jgi:hypothetical protein